MDLIERITDSISEHREMIDNILSDSEFVKEIEHSALIIAESFCSGGTVFAFGNGGSAADAQHIV
ncbi:MAG: SIS domain-containing protein, partial [Candidatus Latescibacteria bacterium]|nr:SIS domain-containing protein [Candidatus Latescibacterota bacterium]